MRHILCLSGLLALAACHGGTQQSDTAQTAPTEVAAQDDTPNPNESPIDPDPDNPLVGDWRLDSGLSCNYDHATFTQDMRVLHMVGDADHPGADIPAPIDKYAVDGPKITLQLVGDDKPGTYVMFDSTHMGDGTPNCRFHKDPTVVSATPTPTP